MKKSAVFLVLSLFLQLFFACQIPTAIEIIGTPSVRFAETVDVGKMFTDLLRNAINKDDRLTIIPCEKTEVITYLVHTNLVNEEFDKAETREDFDDLREKFPGMTLDYDHVILNTPVEKMLIDNTKNKDDYVKLPLSDLGSVLNKFKFYDGEEGYKTILYFSGSQLVERSRIRINIYDIIVGEDGEENYDPQKTIDTMYEEPVESKCSDIENWKANGYDKTDCPSDGLKIAVPLTGKDIAISFQVYIPSGMPISLADFEAGTINVEVVVWLPFMFEAGEEAELSFPEDAFFSSDEDEDLFGRDEPDSGSLFTDIVESLSVGVKFQHSPFNGADLIISSKGIDIHNGIANDTLSFTITEENMKAINNPANYPFKPNIKIGFQKGKILSFKRLFYAVEFSFQAKIRYRIDL